MRRGHSRDLARLHLSREDALLLRTCRAYCSDEDDAAIRAAVRKGVEWDRVVWRSEMFRTTPLVYYHLRRLGLDEAVPGAIAGYLDAWSRLSAARASVLYDELGRIVDALELEGIDYYLLKGAALGPLVYPDLLLRPMIDLDVMIRPGDVPVARSLMRGLGYRHGIWDPETNFVAEVAYAPVDYANHHELPAYHRLVETASPVPSELVPREWRRKHHKCFLHDGTVSFLVFADLHFNLSVGFDLADVWRGVRRQSLLGRSPPIQGATSTLWFLAARLYNEAFQFNTFKLIMFSDLHALLRARGGEVDWEDLVRVAGKYGMQPALYYVLTHLERLTKAGVPEAVLAELAPRSDGVPHTNDWGDLMPKVFSQPIVHELVLS
jgi:hypothetical protein